MAKTVRVFAPATVANIACAFDIMGFAIHGPGDEVILLESDLQGIKISGISGDGGKLPLDPAKNSASVAANAVIKKSGMLHCGFEMKIRKNMPLCSGMGSSAASAVAGALAANQILGEPLSEMEVLECAMEGEFCACASRHADNAAPSLFGGFVLVRSYEPLDIIRLPSPPELFCTLIHPAIEISTKDAREVLPKAVSIKTLTEQCGNIGGLVSGLSLGDYELIGRSLVDRIVEPARQHLIPFFMDVKKAALDAGALGCSISGAGPSIFALSRSADMAQMVADSMAEVYKKSDIGFTVHCSAINRQGAKIIEGQEK